MSAAVAVLCATAAWADNAAVRHFAITAQTLASALREYADQTGEQVVFFSEISKDQHSSEVVGDFTDDAALRRMLAKSGLTFERLDGHTIAITKNTAARAPGHWSTASLATDQSTPYLAQAAVPAAGAPTAGAEATVMGRAEDAADVALQEIVVTGTHIRGVAPAGSALRVYSKEELTESSAATIDQFARQMTENFSGADTIANSSSNIAYARFNGGGIYNGFQGASFDLHGLGPSATLTLLNGHRLAGGGDDGSLIDMSQIPLSAVDHIEVLADGSSAIYGADAVAGVVNIVTRKDFEGAESSLRYGRSTTGGDGEYTGSQLLGTAWGSGNVLMNYEYDRQEGLDAVDRSYIPYQGGADLIVPRNRRNSVLLSGNETIDDKTTLSVDGMYSDRVYETRQYIYAPGVYSRQFGAGNSRLAGMTAALDRVLWGDWHASLTGNFSRLEQLDDSGGDAAFGAFTQTADTLTDVRSSVLDLDLLATGTLFTMPAGPAKAALGASFRHERFDSSTAQSISGTAYAFAVPGLRRNVTSAYVEASLPLIDSPNVSIWTRQLQLSAAVRYDDYSDFGPTTNPKLGVLWVPVAGFNARATYGKSFRAPLLDQLGAPLIADAIPVPNPGAPGGVSDTLLLNGGNPNLHPERSTSVTAGFDVKPAPLPGFKLSATYFHISFHDRIGNPPLAGQNYFDDPAVAPFLTTNPPLGLVQSYFKTPGFTDYVGLGAAGVTAIFDNREANISTSKQSGVDLTATYAHPTDYGQFGFLASATRLIEYKFQAAATVPAVELLNSYGEPTRWKAHTGLRWTRSGLTAMLTVNYVSSYQNTLFTPAETIASWVTEDLYVGYALGASEPVYALRNLKIDLGIQNLTNRTPPYAVLPAIDLLPGQNPIPYDPANSSPVGRLMSLQLTKRW